MIVKKALYCLKSSGTAFWAHLAETLYYLNYSQVHKAVPNVSIQPGVKPDVFQVSWNNILCILHDPAAATSMNKGIQATFKLKGDKIEVATH
jgi:hypothetical protein